MILCAGSVHIFQGCCRHLRVAIVVVVVVVVGSVTRYARRVDVGRFQSRRARLLKKKSSKQVVAVHRSV